MSKFNRIVSIFLSVLFVFQALPISVIAEEIAVTEQVFEDSPVNIIEESIPETEAEVETESPTEDFLEDAELIGEVADLREENVKHFRMSNGLYTAVDYGTAVHYSENDEWVDYDNTLVLKEAEDEDDVAGYTPTKSDVKIKFSPNTSNPNMVKLKYDKYQLRISLEGADKTKAIQVNNPAGGQIDDVSDPLPGLVSSVRYNDILPSTDLEYIVSGSNIKENIIVKAKADSYTYEFNLRVKDVTPVLSDDGDVLFVNSDGKTVFSMPKGFMYDSEGDRSEAVTYSISENGNKKYVLTVSADPEWINDEERAFPVTIDPSVITDKYSKYGTTNIQTSYIGETSMQEPRVSTDHLYVGYDSSTSDEYIMYTKLSTRPVLPNNSIVCDARIYIKQFGFSPEQGNGKLNIGVYKVTGSPWYSGIASRTNISSDMLDYIQTDNSIPSTHSEFYITEAVKEWYTQNEGVPLELVYAAPQGTEFVNEYCSNARFYGCYGTSSDVVANRPFFVVTYRNTVGIESYYTYQTHNIGRAGTAYIADNSGEMTLIKPLLSSPSDTLPFTLSLIYNSQYSESKFTKTDGEIITSDFSNMILGNGWKLSAQQSIMTHVITDIGLDATTRTYLVYTDGDGTQHYFSEDNDTAGTYKDEDGLGLEITSDNSYYYLTDDKDNELRFNKGSGRLICSYDSNDNEIQYYYSTTGQLTSIQWKNNGSSKASTICTFQYDENSYLTSVTDYASRVTSFTYSDGYLQTVTHPDSTKSTYENMWLSGNNNSKHKFSRVYDNESHNGIEYKYDTLGRVKDAQVYSFVSSDTEVYSSLARMLYPSTQRTEVTYSGPDDSVGDNDNVKNMYLFDYWGRTVNVHTAQGSITAKTVTGASSAVYVTTSSETDKKKNRIEISSSIGTPAVNLLSNPSAESRTSDGDAYAWDPADASGVRTYDTFAATSSIKAHSGNYMLRINSSSQSSDVTYFSQTRTGLTVGKKYTFSAYVKVPKPSNYTEGNDPTYYLEASGEQSVICHEFTNSSVDNGWVRLSVTFTADDTTERLKLCTAGHTGDIYFDDMQLEVGEGASAVSIQYNGGMIAEESWSFTTGASYTTSTYLSNGRAIQITGDISREGRAYSTAPINIPSSKSTYTVSGWAKANSVPTHETESKNHTPTFGIKVTLTYTDGTTSEHVGNYSSDLTDWQFISVPVIPTSGKTVAGAQTNLIYDYNSGTAYFDNISFIRDNAVQYTYDENGHVEGVNTAEESADYVMEYKGTPNLLEMVCPGSGTYSYGYDENNNVTSVSCDGVTLNLDREPPSGVVNKTTLAPTNASTTDQKIVTETKYDSTYDHVTSTTDALGNVTSYIYDDTTGNMTRVIAPDGKKTIYSYNSNNDRLTRVANGTTGAFVRYSYNDGHLSSITRNLPPNYQLGTSVESMMYYFSYDDFGNMTTVKVGDNVLSTRTYNQYNGNMLTQTNSAGNVVNYTYDILDRVTQIGYNDGTVLSENSYNGAGGLYMTKDHLASSMAVYTYDDLDRLLTKTTRSLTDSAFKYSVSYKYDSCNRLSMVHYDLPIAPDGLTEIFTYNNDDGSLATFTSLIGDAYTYTYDDLKRLSSVSIAHNNNTALTFYKNYTYTDHATETTQTSMVPKTLEYADTSDNSWLISTNTYNSLGQITAHRDTHIDTTIVNDRRSYAYNTYGQLICEEFLNDNLVYTYTYDAAGNILSWEKIDTSTGVVNSASYTYEGAWADVISAYNDNTILYAGVGLSIYVPSAVNPAESKTLTWTPEGRLYRAKLSGNRQVVALEYDANGLRTSKTYGGVVHEYLYDDGRLITEKINGYSMVFLYDESGNVDCIWYNGDKYYLIRNTFGDVVQLRDASNQVVAYYKYNAFGYLLSVTDANGAEITDTSHIAHLNPIRYRGYYYDAELKMYYLYSRYYNPEMGRFISADVIVGTSLAGTNLFAYCGNDPINYVDLYGYCQAENCGYPGSLTYSPGCELYQEQQAKLHSEKDAEKHSTGIGWIFGGVTLHRPYIRKAIRMIVESRAPKTMSGLFWDINLQRPIYGKYDLGHVPGHEFWREQKKAMEKGWSQKQFNDYMNNPDFYQIEDPSANRSHKFEKKR